MEVTLFVLFKLAVYHDDLSSSDAGQAEHPAASESMQALCCKSACYRSDTHMGGALVNKGAACRRRFVNHRKHMVDETRGTVVPTSRQRSTSGWGTR